MKSFISSIQKNAVIWGIVVLHTILFTISSMASCIMGSLVGTNWATLDNQGRFMVVLAVLVNWALVMMAFLNKSVQKIQQGAIPIGSEDAEIITSRVKNRIESISTTSETTKV